MRAIVLLGVVMFLACGRSPAPASSGGHATAAVTYGYRAGDQPVPADSTRNPFAGNPRSSKEGEQLFASMNCDGCHGGGATGWVAPALNDGRWRYGGSDAAIFQSISFGRPKGMPAFGGLLSPEIIWKLVTYVQSLPPTKSVPTTTW